MTVTPFNPSLHRSPIELSSDLLETQFLRWTLGAQSVEYALPNAHTSFVLELPDGRSEFLDLAPLCDMEYAVYEPYVREDGETVIPLEVLRFENSAVSRTLWPGETVTCKGGRRTHPDAKPIYGAIHVRRGTTLDQGVHNRQTLWSRFWTPLGELTMRYPVNMSGVVRKVDPPLKSRLYSDRPIALFTDEDEHIATIYDCSSVD